MFDTYLDLLVFDVAAIPPGIEPHIKLVNRLVTAQHGLHGGKEEQHIGDLDGVVFLHKVLGVEHDGVVLGGVVGARLNTLHGKAKGRRE